MKKSFKKYLSLVMVLMVAFVCLFSVSVSAASSTETIDFRTNFATYADGWNGYAAKTLDSSELGCSENVTVAFTRVSKQASTITNMPVVAANNSTEYVTVEVADKNIESVSFVLTQWSASKVFSAIKIEYWNGASWASGSETITTPATLTSNTFDGNVTKVRVSIATTKSSNQQIGIQSISLALNEKAGESEEIKNIKTKLNAINPYMSLGYTYTVDSTSKVFSSEEVVFAEKGYANSQVIEESIAESFNVVFSQNTNANNAPTYYTTGTSIRCYGGNAFTVSSERLISQIVLGYGNSDGSNTISTNVGSFDTATWTGEATDVTFTIGGTSGNRRIASITVTYTQEETFSVDVYSDVDFRIRCAVDESLANIEGIDSYGVCVSTSSKAKMYDSEVLETSEGKSFAVVSLGDVLNNDVRISTTFTVKAYVVVDEEIYYSEIEKEYSLLQLVEYYVAHINDAEFQDFTADEKDQVINLSNLLNELLK